MVLSAAVVYRFNKICVYLCCANRYLFTMGLCRVQWSICFFFFFYTPASLPVLTLFPTRHVQLFLRDRKRVTRIEIESSRSWTPELRPGAADKSPPFRLSPAAVQLRKAKDFSTERHRALYSYDSVPNDIYHYTAAFKSPVSNTRARVFTARDRNPNNNIIIITIISSSSVLTRMPRRFNRKHYVLYMYYIEIPNGRRRLGRTLRTSIYEFVHHA